MEPRKVTIINSKTQSQTVITNSTATTLGELKAELDMQNIDYSDMSFFEGHMRAELIDDSSVLPEEIPYKGGVVRDLVFMLTATNKKIKSGADFSQVSRADVYAEIKKRNLQECCKSTYGKNYTQCSTVDLIKLIEMDEECEAYKASANKDTTETFVTDLQDILLSMLQHLCRSLIIDENTKIALSNKAHGLYLTPQSTPKKETTISAEEIKEMFDFI